ncbi:hypothetical protein KFK09_005799 [Dendrobium nobile]|uniref:Uncharacterized protein n=1 Tax=Dendrobium nobile TaxID=94219 RepID=A0A8T3BWQ4_DENNO|nr:hypothetical protein KFK09_005799 [Dendrobium nobile]
MMITSQNTMYYITNEEIHLKSYKFIDRLSGNSTLKRSSKYSQGRRKRNFREFELLESFTGFLL